MKEIEMGISKCAENPIIKKEDVPFRVNSIFNPGAIKFNGEYILLCRVEMPDGRSSLLTARSQDGIKFKIDNAPSFTPVDQGEYSEYAVWGVEDPRITKIEDEYYITYTGYSKHFPLVMLATTKDFSSFEPLGIITEPTNKDCALFPEKINGYYWKMDRPVDGIRNSIWINRSPDLIHWGNYKCLMTSEPGTWEADKIGGSTPPVRTEKGWLCLYHGVRGFGTSNIYKIGALLLDLNEPWKILGKTIEPILAPDHNYERVGDVQNVVFTNGWIVEDSGEVKIYYSGADMNICLALTSVDYLLSQCK